MGVACVGGGLVKCRVALDRGGYVPGESVVVTAFISNNSNVTIKRTKASLTEVSHFELNLKRMNSISKNTVELIYN